MDLMGYCFKKCVLTCKLCVVLLHWLFLSFCPSVCYQAVSDLLLNSLDGTKNTVETFFFIILIFWLGEPQIDCEMCISV